MVIVVLTSGAVDVGDGVKATVVGGVVVNFAVHVACIEVRGICGGDYGESCSVSGSESSGLLLPFGYNNFCFCRQTTWI